MDREQHQDLSEEELEKQLPALNTWAESTWSQMLKGINWNTEYGSYEGPNFVPKPPRYLILQGVSLRPQLMAMTKLCLHTAHPGDPEDEIPDWPTTEFEPGSACHGALLGQLESFMFAELLASHKSSWPDKVLGTLTVFAGVIHGVADPLSIFAWKVEQSTGHFRNDYHAQMGSTRRRIGGPPSDTSSQSSDASDPSRSMGARSLQKRTPYDSIPPASQAVISDAYWNGDWVVQMMAGDANLVNTIITTKLGGMLDFTQAEMPWQRDNVHWSDLNKLWDLGIFKGEKWDPETLGEQDCDLGVGGIDQVLQDLSLRHDILRSVYAFEADDRGPNLCMRAKQDISYTNTIGGVDHHITVSSKLALRCSRLPRC